MPTKQKRPLSLSPARNKGFILTGACASMMIVSAMVGIAGWSFFNPYTELTPGIQYGTRNGQPLKIDVMKPLDPNGKGVLLMVSGSWKSSKEPIAPWLISPLLRGGYTVFGVHHISQPESVVSNIVEDVKLATRYIRHNADKYGVDKDLLGITGGSSGGHLSLMVATTGDDGDKSTTDPIRQEGSKVQAVAIYFPVTDLLNMGESTENLHDGGPPKNYVAAFGMKDRDPAKWEPVGRALSPLYNIKPNLPPTLIIHGTADTLVPLDQSTRYQDAATSAGNTVKIIKVNNKGHGWPGMIIDNYKLKNWFDKYLSKDKKQ